MPATLDINVSVNVLDSPGAVNRKDFGIPVHATADVGAGFTELIRYYASANEAAQDTDLNASAQTAVAAGFSQDPHPAKVGVAKVAYISLATDLDALKAFDDSWYGLDLFSRAQADIEAAAAWAEANEKLFCPQTSDAALLAGTPANVGLNLQAASYDRTGLSYHSDDAEHLAFALLCHRLAINPDEKSTIWAYAQLAGITVDSVNSTQKTNILAASANLYIPFKGQPAYWPGTLASGRYFDQRTTADWFKARTEERLAQLLIDATNRGEKVPYDNDGIGMVANQISAQLSEGERLKHFRADSSTLQIPVISDIPQATIQSRKLTISGQTVLAGAIQEITANITVLVTL